MRSAYAFLVMLVLVGPVAAGARDDAFAVVERFKKAYDASDPQSIVKLFSPNAVFLGTQLQGPTRDPEAILKYFEASAAANLPKKITIEKYEVLEISKTAVLFSGQDIFSQTRDGQIVDTPARFTLLIINGPEGWRIAHFHSSARPKVQ